MKIEERNQSVTYWLNAKLTRAKSLLESDFKKLKEAPEVSRVLADLIETNAKGFRGVVLTSLAGHHVDPNFSPLKDFYACNPRSIFEHAIWYVLTEHNIPCGKSDPLNVAKNINTLDENWAKDRRPEKSALAAVHFMERFFHEKDAKQKALLEDLFFYKLVKYAESIAGIEIVGANTSTVSRQWLAESLVQFSLNAPESGATPQLLIAVVMKQLFARSNLSVCGGDESVFGTNTTSKKPADIWIEDDGNVALLYEVTLKKVDQKRLEDLIGSTRAMRLDSIPITFICRIPEDTSALSGIKSNTLEYKGKRIEFVDYASFVRSSFSMIGTDSAEQIHDSMHEFVGLVTTSVATKNMWNLIFNG